MKYENNNKNFKKKFKKNHLLSRQVINRAIDQNLLRTPSLHTNNHTKTNVKQKQRVAWAGAYEIRRGRWLRARPSDERGVATVAAALVSTRLWLMRVCRRCAWRWIARWAVGQWEQNKIKMNSIVMTTKTGKFTCLPPSSWAIINSSILIGDFFFFFWQKPKNRNNQKKINKN